MNPTDEWLCRIHGGEVGALEVVGATGVLASPSGAHEEVYPSNEDFSAPNRWSRVRKKPISWIREQRQTREEANGKITDFTESQAYLHRCDECLVEFRTGEPCRWPYAILMTAREAGIAAATSND